MHFNHMDFLGRLTIIMKLSPFGLYYVSFTVFNFDPDRLFLKYCSIVFPLDI